MCSPLADLRVHSVFDVRSHICASILRRATSVPVDVATAREAGDCLIIDSSCVTNLQSMLESSYPDGCCPSVWVLKPGVYSPIKLPSNLRTRSGTLVLMAEEKHASILLVESFFP